MDWRRGQAGHLPEEALISDSFPMKNSRFWFCQAAALLAVGVSLFTMGKGLIVSPDGWAYWQGSVSILEKGTYTDFQGNALIWWPPLYSLYLAGIQALFGVSGGSMVLAQCLLVYGATAVWVWAGLREHESGTIALGWHVLFGLFLASYIPVYFSQLLSETLLIFLLGVAWVIVQRLADKASSAVSISLYDYGSLTVVFAAILLTRNVGLVFVAAFSFIICMRLVRLLGWARAVAASALVGAASLAAWYVVRAFLGQLGSHPASIASLFDWEKILSYGGQIWADWTYRIGPDEFHLGAVILCSGLVFLVPAMFGRYGGRSMRQAQDLGLFLVISTLGLLAVFLLVWVDSQLGDRFFWHLPILLACANLAVVAGHDRAVMPRAAIFPAMFFLVMVSVSQVYRTYVHIELRLQPEWVPHVSLRQYISSDYPRGIPVDKGNLELIPPYYSG